MKQLEEIHDLLDTAIHPTCDQPSPAALQFNSIVRREAQKSGRPASRHTNYKKRQKKTRQICRQSGFVSRAHLRPSSRGSPDRRGESSSSFRSRRNSRIPTQRATAGDGQLHRRNHTGIRARSRWSCPSAIPYWLKMEPLPSIIVTIPVWPAERKSFYQVAAPRIDWKGSNLGTDGAHFSALSREAVRSR